MYWPTYFISIAEAIRHKSKDPSSKIGVVIVGPENQIISTGFNGFARGIDETDKERWDHRPTKYDYVEHAERNAIYNAARHGIALRGCTMYMVGMGPPTVPCTDCARGIIQAGIIIFVGCPYKEVPKRWEASLALSSDMLAEAGVKVVEAISIGSVS